MEKNKNNHDNMNNALNWMFTIDGCKRDIRKEPREFQEQAYYSGMIPFIPADYPKHGKAKEIFENNIRIVELSPANNKKFESEPISE